MRIWRQKTRRWEGWERKGMFSKENSKVVKMVFKFLSFALHMSGDLVNEKEIYLTLL